MVAVVLLCVETNKVGLRNLGYAMPQSKVAYSICLLLARVETLYFWTTQFSSFCKFLRSFARSSTQLSETSIPIKLAWLHAFCVGFRACICKRFNHIKSLSLAMTILLEPPVFSGLGTCSTCCVRNFWTLKTNLSQIIAVLEGGGSSACQGILGGCSAAIGGFWWSDSFLEGC